jgi:hypothetical protein
VWLQYLREHHPDYRYTILFTTRLDALLIDKDGSVSLPVIDDLTEDIPDLSELPTDPTAPVTDELPPPNTQSMVPNLNTITTEVDLIREQLADLPPEPRSVPAPSIRQTPLDEASDNERLFTIAFLTLYPTGAADFNSP